MEKNAEYCYQLFYFMHMFIATLFCKKKKIQIFKIYIKMGAIYFKLCLIIIKTSVCMSCCTFFEIGQCGVFQQVGLLGLNYVSSFKVLLQKSYLILEHYHIQYPHIRL